MNIEIDDGVIVGTGNCGFSSSDHKALRTGIAMAADVAMQNVPLTDASPYAVYVIVLKMDDINKENEKAF